MSFDLVVRYLMSQPFLQGAWTTLLITMVSLFFGVLAGFVMALAQQIRFWPVKVLIVLYLWLFRGTPGLFQIIFIYNVLPSFDIRFNAFWCGVIALPLNEGAYMAEIRRISGGGAGLGRKRGHRQLRAGKRGRDTELGLSAQDGDLVFPASSSENTGTLVFSPRRDDRHHRHPLGGGYRRRAR